jgi:hypothetical protein
MCDWIMYSSNIAALDGQGRGVGIPSDTYFWILTFGYLLLDTRFWILAFGYLLSYCCLALGSGHDFA